MNVNYYMEVKNAYKLNNYFNESFYADDKLLEVTDNELISNNGMIKNFFRYYQEKLLSYDFKDLREIFKESNFRISHLIVSNNRCLSISRDHIEFYDYDDINNSYYDMNSKYEEALVDLNRYMDEAYSKRKHVKKLSDTTFKVIDNDIIFHTIVDDLNKDDKGIYIIKNGNKKYVFQFGRNVCE